MLQKESLLKQMANKIRNLKLKPLPLRRRKQYLRAQKIPIGGADAKKKAAQGDAEQSELSGIEKIGAVVGAEGELIGTQATGNKIAAQEESDETNDPKEMQKSAIRAAILASYFGTYDEPAMPR